MFIFFYVYIYMVVICFQKLQGALSQCYLRSFKVSSSIQNGQHWIEVKKIKKERKNSKGTQSQHFIPLKGKGTVSNIFVYLKNHPLQRLQCSTQTFCCVWLCCTLIMTLKHAYCLPGRYRFGILIVIRKYRMYRLLIIFILYM